MPTKLRNWAGPFHFTFWWKWLDEFWIWLEKPTCGKRFPLERVKVWREASERVVGFVLFCFDCIAKQVGRKWSTTPQGGLCRSAPWYDTVQRVWKCGNVLFPHSLHYHLTGLTCKDISEMSEFGRKPLQISCYQYLQPIPWVGCWMLGGKRSEIASPPAHPCFLVCAWIDLFSTSRRWIFPRRKHPWKLMKTYGLVAMSASCEDLSSGHYYAMGRRSEPTSSGDLGWYAMDDSQIKAAETFLWTGNSPEKLLDDNACVAKKAAPTSPGQLLLLLINEDSCCFDFPAAFPQIKDKGTYSFVIIIIIIIPLLFFLIIYIYIIF